MQLSPAEVVDYLDAFLSDRGEPWDWDDFTSIPIDDAALNEIRLAALGVDLPLTERGEAELRRLLAKATAIAGDASN